MTRRLTWIGAFIALTSMHASAQVPTAPAPALESSPDLGDPPAYRELVEQAAVEDNAQNFAEARALLLKAHEIFPNARTLRGLGLVEFELKNYGECIARLEAALASRKRPLDAALRKQTEDLLARAKLYVARYELDLQPPSEGARVAIDGVPVELAAGQALTLTVGEHIVQVQVPGYQEEKRALNVTGGEEQRIRIELRATRPAPALATSTPPQKTERSLWSSPWLWTGFGAVVVGGVVTAVLLSGHKEERAAPVQGQIATVQALMRQ